MYFSSQFALHGLRALAEYSRPKKGYFFTATICRGGHANLGGGRGESLRFGLTGLVTAMTAHERGEAGGENGTIKLVTICPSPGSKFFGDPGSIFWPFLGSSVRAPTSKARTYKSLRLFPKDPAILKTLRIVNHYGGSKSLRP